MTSQQATGVPAPAIDAEEDNNPLEDSPWLELGPRKELDDLDGEGETEIAPVGGALLSLMDWIASEQYDTAIEPKRPATPPLSIAPRSGPTSTTSIQSLAVAGDARSALWQSFDTFVARRGRFEDDMKPREIEVLTLHNEDIPSGTIEQEPWVNVQQTRLVKIADVSWMQDQLDELQLAMQNFLNNAMDLLGPASSCEPPPSLGGSVNLSDISQAGLHSQNFFRAPSLAEAVPDGVHPFDGDLDLDDIGRTLVLPGDASDGASALSKRLPPRPTGELGVLFDRLGRRKSERGLLQEQLVDLYVRYEEEHIDRNFRQDQDQILDESDSHFDERFSRERKDLNLQIKKLSRQITKLEARCREKGLDPTTRDVFAPRASDADDGAELKRTSSARQSIGPKSETYKGQDLLPVPASEHNLATEDWQATVRLSTV